MKSSAKKDYFSELIYISLALLAAVTMIYLCKIEPNNKINYYKDKVNIINDGWRLENSSYAESTEITLPSKVKDSDDKHIIICRDIDEKFTEENSSMYISSYYSDVYVYINDKMIFDYQSYKEGIGVSEGIVRFIVKLPDIKEDSVLKIEYIPQFKMNVYKIKCPIFGDETDIFKHFYYKNLFDIVISIIFILIGITIILIYIMSTEKIKREMGFIHIGVYALLTGVYLIDQIETVHMIVEYKKALYVSEFISLSLLSLPVLILIYKYTYDKYKILFKSASIIMIINLFGQMILYVSGKMELRSMVKCSHILLAASVILIAVIVLSEQGGEALVRLGLKKDVIVLCISGICELISYYIGAFPTVGIFLKIGILLFIVFQIRFNLNRYVQLCNDMKNEEIYKNLAYIDLLTGMSNRNAYERDLNELNEKMPSLKSLQCVMIDINGLKAANDIYGHAAGDALIKGIGILLKYVLDEQTKLYRIGGDEFVIIFENISKERVSRKLKEIERRKNEYNMSADIKISYAMGIASYLGEKHKSIKDIIKEADSMMYQNKATAKMCKL
ncbi:GGDEF domain-containing protein [uncultured Clostridium sp.]|uniref:GGDEF domain-containing protein n=1 Tax=uncultured Clostridium sp. TaxID=59620 RepID=UPI0025D20783|nr:GGDEF domain-containing protein [uncultured Clostridium sp.]